MRQKRRAKLSHLDYIADTGFIKISEWKWLDVQFMLHVAGLYTREIWYGGGEVHISDLAVFNTSCNRQSHKTDVPIGKAH